MAVSPEPRTTRTLMGRLRDLPVGRKLLLGFGSVALVVLMLVAVVLGAMDQLGVANGEIVDTALPKVEAADDVRFAAADLRAAQHAYLIDGGASRAAFESASQSFEDGLGHLRAVVASPAERALTEKIATGFQTYLAVDGLIWRALQDGQVQSARNLSLGAEGLDFGFMESDARAAADLARVQQRSATAEFESTADDARIVALASGGLAVLLVITLSLIVTRSIRTPLEKVQGAAERAAGGDLEAEAEVLSRDEIGRLAGAFNVMLGSLRRREELALGEHARQQLDGRLTRALEMADNEERAYDAIGRAFDEIRPGHPSELLLADSSKAHLEVALANGPDGAVPGCPVGSPYDCPAVRNGHAMVFPTSEAIDACPLLRDRPTGSCSAACVPVSFMGRALGVIHTVGPDGTPPEVACVDELEMLATKAGARIGVLRSFARTHAQANTDGLTGLLNRRTLETRVRAMHRAGVQFGLVMADLDHFKRLNDTHGHEAGDRALRVFTDVLREGSREGDLVCRFGGEEFVFVAAGADAEEAASLADRIRLLLSERLTAADVPMFTASFGVVDSRYSSRLEDLLRAADGALYEAKDEGRDRVVIAGGLSGTTRGPSTNGHPELDPVLASVGFAAFAADDDPLDP